MRLIDADAKDLKERININFGSVTRFIVKSILKDAPTIDAVEVVRCKDCKFYGNEDDCPLLSFANYTESMDFCSCGERRSE